MTRTPTYADIVFGNQRPDTVIIDKADKTVFMLEFERTTDQRSRRERAEVPAFPQHLTRRRVTRWCHARRASRKSLNYDFALSSGAGT